MLVELHKIKVKVLDAVFLEQILILEHIREQGLSVGAERIPNRVSVTVVNSGRARRERQRLLSPSSD